MPKTKSSPQSIIDGAVARLPVVDHVILDDPDDRCPNGFLCLISAEIADAAEVAVGEALRQANPRVARRAEALRRVFDDRWADIECALRETAFALGVEYGRRLAAGGER